MNNIVLEVIRGTNPVSMSTASNYRLGEELFRNGSVEITGVLDEEVLIYVKGNPGRKVKLMLAGSLIWKCTCRKGQKTFCKHVIAAILKIKSMLKP